MAATSRQFTTTVTAAPRGQVLIPVPFDPDTVWGGKRRHLVGGTVNGVRVRGALTTTPDGYALTLSRAWLRDCHLALGDNVADLFGLKAH